ncbi:MAG: hypothetical protein LAT83_13385, partial [Kiritimatiellae bacterium]|nr:hypothetical protein [Kiritimatiellia bacterium]
EVVNRSGSVIVNVKDLQRLVKKAAKDSVRLIDVKPDQAEITLSGELGERTHYLPAYPEDEWPEPVPEIPVQDADGRFLETLRQVQPFASTDETRYVLNGAAIQQHEGSHLLVTTDGHRLCASQPLSLPLDRDLIVPPHKFALWSKLSPDCALGADERYFRLVSGPWSLTVKQIEGEFPRWRQILPRHEDPKTFTLHPDDLPAFEEAVRTLPGQQSVIPTDGDTLLFLEQEGKLTLECTNVETGKHQRTLPRSRADAEVWIPLQRGYVLQAVKAGFTTWRMQDSLCPIQSEKEDGGIHVLMPMRYEGEAKFPAPGKARQGPARGSTRSGGNAHPTTRTPKGGRHVHESPRIRPDRRRGPAPRQHGAVPRARAPAGTREPRRPAGDGPGCPQPGPRPEQKPGRHRELHPDAEETGQAAPQ